MLHSPAAVTASSLSGDYIGLESCVDLRDNEEELSSGNGGCGGVGKHGRRDRSWGTKKKEFPPPIPWLAQTENLLSHMPWVMRRYHTSDGRLIIREEKVKHHEYFRAHRANGRLTLHLVPVGDHFDEDETPKGGEAEEDDEGNAEEDEDAGDAEEEMEDDEEEEEEEEKEQVKPSCVEMKGGGGTGGGGGKSCMRFISSCMLGVAVGS